MKCYLHIGTEKTATTSIQRFLSVNREKLLNLGLFYPESLGSVNSIKLAVAAYHPNHHDDTSMSMGISSNDPEMVKKFREKVISDLEAEINRITEINAAVSLILSSEHFHSRLKRVSEIETLKTILNHIGVTKFSVVVYLRKPADLAASLFSTAIKSGHNLESPPLPSDSYFNNLCHHQKTLEKFGSVFGESALNPRIFHKTEFANGSVFEDFLSVLQISVSLKNFVIPAKVNESLSLLGIELLRRVNKRIPRIIGTGMNPVRGNIVSFFENHFTAPGYRMPAELYQQYQEAFSESNEWVRMHFFPDKQTLFPEEPEPVEIEQQFSPQNLDCIADLISDIWLEKSRH